MLSHLAFLPGTLRAVFNLEKCIFHKELFETLIDLQVFIASPNSFKQSGHRQFSYFSFRRSNVLAESCTPSHQQPPASFLQANVVSHFEHFFSIEGKLVHKVVHRILHGRQCNGTIQAMR
jgi:hypothetical protein